MSNEKEIPPICHLTPMFMDEADLNDWQTVCWWECKHCGHMKDMQGNKLEK